MSWKINNKFVYPKSMRSIYKGSRHYDVGGFKYPSVTSILAETKSQKDIDALNKWKKDLGYAAAAAVRAKQMLVTKPRHQQPPLILLPPV